ncbi:MAG: quinolinate synthase NadA [Candidatus Cloacimonetes bacterium]|nr:quinolinate synthase NadA [Candidatus Cloacimonadota bacterium]
MLTSNQDRLSNTELKQSVLSLKKKKNCLILAHNYQALEVQEIADLVGDSLEMAKYACTTDHPLVMLCGIRLMAETVKMLNPEKKVLLSHETARCPLAEMKKIDELLELKERYPQAEVVCYVNATSDLKAESTISCTSGNVGEVISKLPAGKEIIFIPDRNLGSWGAMVSGRSVIMWDGYCPVHDQITLGQVKDLKMKYPRHKLAVHPECKPEICKIADYVCSTSQMISYTQENDRVIIGTEIGLYRQLAAKYPEKDLVPMSEQMICANMQKTTLAEVAKTLADEENEITLDQDIMIRAKASLERMFRLTGN